MNRKIAVIAGVVLVAAAAGAFLMLRSPAPPPQFHGWVEADLLFVGADEPGRVTSLAVREGEAVKSGALLFTLQSDIQDADLQQAQGALDEARARLAKAEAAQQRPEEVAVLQAQEARAQAALENSQPELERTRKLVERGIAAQSRLDQAKAAYDRDSAQLIEVRRQIEVARLKARSEDIEAAREIVKQGEAKLASAKTRHTQRRVSAPADSVVQEIYFRTGEIVPAGRPVVSLLPPGNLKLRFFVPQSALPAIALGDEVSVTCDGCANGIRAEVTFIARQAEFTPPVIFSSEERAKLVFRVEASRASPSCCASASRPPSASSPTSRARPRMANAETRTPEPVIEVEGLTKSFGSKVVVRNLTMRVNRGQIYGFLGPNGSGKTTTIRMLCGLLTPDAGRGTCLGYDILTEAHLIKQHVGYMTQRFSLYQDLSIRENLEFVARVFGLPDPPARARAAIERLGLGGREAQLAGELSGGWKQRLALGACILPEPDLLLLDEPTAGVDPKARREFWAEIHTLAAEGLTVLVSTHYMDEAERCHEIAYIAYGELLTHGTVDEVIQESRPHHLECLRSRHP